MGEENNFSFNMPLKKQANMIKVIGVWRKCCKLHVWSGN